MEREDLFLGWVTRRRSAAAPDIGVAPPKTSSLLYTSSLLPRRWRLFEGFVGLIKDVEVIIFAQRYDLFRSACPKRSRVSP